MRASPTLPANPFGDLDARDLASFVECTLYEASVDVEEITDVDLLIPIHVAAPERVRRPAGAGRTARGPRLAARAARGPRIVACAACTFIGLAAALVLRWSIAAAEQPAAPRAARAVLASAGPTRPAAPPAVPLVEPIGPAPEEAAPSPPVPRRKMASLIIGSSPPGAEIVVNGEGAGRAPTRLEVPRFEEVEIQATLDGYVPWKKAVYVSRPETRIGTSLTPVEEGEIRVFVREPDDEGRP